MDNRINKIRKEIRALRISMLEAEALMRDQVNRDEDCSAMAGDILSMRTEMSRLVRERRILGDREPILVACAPRRMSARRTIGSRPAKRCLTRH